MTPECCPLAPGRDIPEGNDRTNHVDRRDRFPLGVEGEGADAPIASPPARQQPSARRIPDRDRAVGKIPVTVTAAGDDEPPIGGEGHACDGVVRAAEPEQLEVAEAVEIVPLEAATVGAILSGRPVLREAPTSGLEVALAQARAGRGSSGPVEQSLSAFLLTVDLLGGTPDRRLAARLPAFSARSCLADSRASDSPIRARYANRSKERLPRAGRARVPPPARRPPVARAPSPGPFQRADGPGQDRPALEPAPEVVGQVGGRGVAPCGRLLQALQADRLQVARRPSVELPRRHRARCSVTWRSVSATRRRLERRPAGQQLVEDRAEAVDVGRRRRSRSRRPAACSGAM